ncbi:signal peptidase II [Cellulomonas sp. Y8]|uniref:signal peptidase II n=1 Tax=Cellulomonas sp. Y8 TaxID=2591145 RepID=UPI0011C8839D|nr:signal peptidase II [Cellulomonas sp. Y8]
MSATPGPAADDARRDAASAAPVPPASEPAASGAGAPAADPEAVAPARRRRLVATLVALAAVTLVLDQATKAWALAGLDEGVRHPVLGDLLGLQLLFNPGAALGLATGTTWLLTIVAITVVVVIIRVSRRLGSTGWTIALGLLLGGALGNLVDRLIRDPGVFMGHVVDFIAYGDLFVGNVADIAIVAAAGLLMLLSLMGVRLDGTRERREDAAEPSDGAAGATPATTPEDGRRDG